MPTAEAATDQPTQQPAAWPIVKPAPKKHSQPKAKAAKASPEANPKPKAQAQPCQSLQVVEPTEAANSGQLVADQPKKIGRPKGSGLKLTPEVQQTILAAISRGLTVDKAAILAGISNRSLVRWREAYPAFLDECRKAEVQAEDAFLASLKVKGEGGNKLWTADAWVLERRFGWHPVSRSEITGAQGGPIQHLTVAKTLLARVGGMGDRASRAKPVDIGERP